MEKRISKTNLYIRIILLLIYINLIIYLIFNQVFDFRIYDFGVIFWFTVIISLEYFCLLKPEIKKLIMKHFI